MAKRIVGSSCSAALLVVTLAAAQETKQAPAQPITVSGCVTEQSSAAAAASGVSEAKHEGLNLLLTKASSRATRTAEVASAVPGSRPSGSGSGTIPTTPASGAAVAGEAKLIYALTGSGASPLARYVGQRVEIIGTIDAESMANPQPSGRNVTATGGRTEPTTTSSAHPSATPQRLIVTSFRTVAGAC